MHAVHITACPKRHPGSAPPRALRLTVTTLHNYLTTFSTGLKYQVVVCWPRGFRPTPMWQREGWPCCLAMPTWRVGLSSPTTAGARPKWTSPRTASLSSRSLNPKPVSTYLCSKEEAGGKLQNRGSLGVVRAHFVSWFLSSRYTPLPTPSMVTPGTPPPPPP